MHTINRCANGRLLALQARLTSDKQVIIFAYRIERVSDDHPYNVDLGSPSNRSSHKSLGQLTAATTASRGPFSSTALKRRPLAPTIAGAWSENVVTKHVRNSYYFVDCMMAWHALRVSIECDGAEGA
jgi:hypothetical protein